jgi:ABC-type nitrate/sulfonate/bicarbonate transport system permease component
MKKITRFLKPFEKIDKSTGIIITLFWVIALLTLWASIGFGDTHMFPTMGEVAKGFIGLYNEGLVVHMGSSLLLCSESVLIAIIISLTLTYMSSTPAIKPISTFISKFRYLPLTGITFYITVLIDDARVIQVWTLVIFMTTFLTTSLLAMMKDIPEEEFDHARSLGYGRWQILLEVVIKGRFDYVIENIRQNLAIVWMMLVTVESTVVAAGGLGFLIKNSDKFMNHGRIIALQIIILGAGLGLDLLLTTTRKAAFRFSKI